MTYSAILLELSAFLGKNLIVIFFVYGLSFFFIAGAVLLGLKALKSINLGRAFFCLFAFSIIHGSVECIDMYQKYRLLLYDSGTGLAVIRLRFFMLMASFYFLFLFSLELLAGTGLKPGMKKYRAGLALPFLLMGLLAAGQLVKTDAAGMELWIRYLMGFPSAILAGVAFFRLSQKEHATALPAGYAWYLRSSSYLIVVYGLTMLVVPKSRVFFASYLNQNLFFQDSFFEYTGVPIQAIRALTALLISYCIVRAMAMRISFRLAGTFIVFIVLLVFSGFTGFVNLKLVVKSYKDVVKLAEEEKDFSYLYKSFDRMYNFVHNPDVARNRELYGPLLKEYTGDFEAILGEIKAMTHEDPEEAEAISGISTLYEESFKYGMRNIGFGSLEKLKALISRVNAMHSRESDEQRQLVLKNASNFNHIIFITLFVSFLGAIFIWYAFYKVLVLPIQSLRNGARQIAEGNLNYRINLNTADELQEFAAEFNSMGEKLLERTTKLEAVTRELHELSVKDGLTGLYNHRYFYTNLKKELERTQRYGTNLSLLILDVDDFKHYNDTFGHMKGDDVLRAIAGIIGSNLRGADIACRYGGEEFAIILPESTKEGAAVTAERIRRAIEAHVFPHEKSQPLGNVTASIGVSAYPADSIEPDSLVKGADAALYRAKREGKNRVTLAQSKTGPAFDAAGPG